MSLDTAFPSAHSRLCRSSLFCFLGLIHAHLAVPDVLSIQAGLDPSQAVVATRPSIWRAVWLTGSRFVSDSAYCMHRILIDPPIIHRDLAANSCGNGNQQLFAHANKPTCFPAAACGLFGGSIARQDTRHAPLSAYNALPPPPTKPAISEHKQPQIVCCVVQCDFQYFLFSSSLSAVIFWFWCHSSPPPPSPSAS